MSSTSHVPELESLRSQVADLTRELAARDDSREERSRHLEQELLDLREQSNLLRAIVEGTAAETGNDFFTSLVTHLTSTLKVQYAFVGEVMDDQARHIRTLAVSAGDSLVGNFEYELKHAPCSTALQEPFWCYEEGVQIRFPDFPPLATLGIESHCGVSLRTKSGDVVGLLIVMDTKPLPNTERLKSLMHVFASRAAAELLRKRAEDALRESEERFRAFLDHAPSLAFVKRTDGRYLYANRPFEEVFHLPNREALGKTDAELFSPEQAAQFHTHDQQVLETGTALEFEEVAWHADGPHTSLVVKFPLRDASGQIYAVGGIATDITARKRAEDALCAQERHFVSAQALAHLGSWEWDLESDEVIWSDEHYRIFGHEPRSIVITSDTFLTALHPDDHDRILQTVNDTLVAQKPFDTECRIVRPNGEVRIIHARGEVHRDATGHPIRMDGTVLDITEQKQVEEALRASEERWHLAIQGSNDGMWDWNIRTGQVFFSTRWKAMRGYGEHELSNALDEWRSRIHPDDLERVLQAVDAYFCKQRPDFCEEYRVQRKDGSYIWVLDRGVALWADDGTPLRMAGSESDITERKRAEEALVRSRNLMTSFVEHTPAAVAMLDKDLRYVAVSRRWLEDYRLGHQQLIGRHHYDVFPEIKDLKEWQEIHQRCLSGAVERCEEDRLIRSDGSEDYLRWEVRPWHDIDGEIGGIIMYTEVITERKRAEDALRESEARTRSIIETALDAVISIDRDGRIIGWNSQAAVTFGYSAQEAIGRNLSETIIPVQYRQAHAAGIERVLQNVEGPPVKRRMELHALHRDGHEFPVEFAITMTHVGGQPVLTAFIRDITEQTQAAEDLAQRERQLRTVLEALPVGIWFTDSHGRVLLANPAARQLWRGAQHIGIGVGADQSNWWETIGPAAEPHRWMLSNVLTKGEPASDDTLEIACEDGTRKTVRNSAVPVRADDGSIQGAILLNEDITERVRAEHERARTQAFLESIIENIPHMITVKDAKDLRFVTVNRAAEQFFERSRTDLVGSSVFDVLDEEEATQIFASDLEVLTRKGSMEISDHLVHSPSHGPRVLRTKKLPIFAPHGQPQHLLSISEDVTERTQAEAVEQQRVAQLLQFQSAQLRFSKITHANLEADFRVITEATAEALNVERVSIWLFHETLTSMVCQDLYTLSNRRHQSGTVLEASHYPQYFAALESALIVAAHDAGTDPRIDEFASYLQQCNIGSRLDVPIRHDGKLIGVLRHEHVGSAREWSSEEEAFTISIADHVVLCLAAAERRWVEAALRTSEERFEKAFRASPHPVIIAEAESGLIIEANDAVYQLFGYEQKEVEGRTTLEIGLWPDPEDRARFIEHLQRRGSVRNLEVALRTKDGQLRQCLLSSERIELHGRQCMVTVGNDISEQKRAEEALRQSQTRLTEAQRIAHIGSWELNLADKKLTWSDEIYRIFEIDPQQFRASYEAFLELVHPQDRDVVHRAYAESVANRHPYNIVHRLLMPDGRIKFVREQCETSYDSDGHPTRSLGTAQDITEQKRAEEALQHREQDLRHAMEERERISQDLHDGILQSLYAVGLGLETCKPLIKQEKQQKALDVMEQAIGQLNHVMGEVRNFIAGLESEVLQGGDFETAVRTVINTVIQSHPIDCRIHIEHEALPYIPMDRALQLLNILREALSNIVRHAQASHISVSIRRLRRTIRIRIHDNGIGFDLKTATGTGHGLLNMAARAKKIRTEFELHSALGEGTTIILDLPKEEAYAHG